MEQRLKVCIDVDYIRLFVEDLRRVFHDVLTFSYDANGTDLIVAKLAKKKAPGSLLYRKHIEVCHHHPHSHSHPHHHYLLVLSS